MEFDPIGGGVDDGECDRGWLQGGDAGGRRRRRAGIALFSVPAAVGAGLQEGALTARLGATAHGGVTVRIASSDPTLALVSRTATGAGAAFVDIPVANGSTDATYFIQGVRDARGRVTVTASATGFTSQGSTLDIVAPALDIQALPSSVSATGATAVFYVRVGIANAFGTALSVTQEVAPGAASRGDADQLRGIGRAARDDRRRCADAHGADCAGLVQFADHTWSWRRGIRSAFRR